VIGGLRGVSVVVLLCAATVSAGLAQGIEIGANLGLTRTSLGGDSDSDAAGSGETLSAVK